MLPLSCVAICVTEEGYTADHNIVYLVEVKHYRTILLGHCSFWPYW